MHTKFYILKPAVDTEETGHVFPTVESYENYDFNAPDSVYNLDSNSFPDFTPDIRFKLAKGAKLCDVMGQSTISACGLLVSPKIKDAFKQFDLIPHKYFPATIEYNGSFLQYYWIHLVWENGIKHLDFEKSKFQINEFGENLGDIELNSHKELLARQTELGFMKMIYNYDTLMNNIVFDLFIHPLNQTIYISEKITNHLVAKSLSGIEISIASNLLVR